MKKKNMSFAPQNTHLDRVSSQCLYLVVFLLQDLDLLGQKCHFVLKS